MSKNIPDIISCNSSLEGLSDFNNFWYEYFGHNWPLNDRSSSHLTQLLLLRYQGKVRARKICVEMNKKRQYISSLPLCGNSRLITRFDCHAAQRVCQMTFRVVMTPRSNWWSLHWSGAEHYRHCYFTFSATAFVYLNALHDSTKHVCSNSGTVIQLLPTTEVKWCNS